MFPTLGGKENHLHKKYERKGIKNGQIDNEIKR